MLAEASPGFEERQKVGGSLVEVQLLVQSVHCAALLTPLALSPGATNGAGRSRCEYPDRDNSFAKHVPKNLALQERRLRNHLEKDTAQFRTLQKERLDKRRNEIALSIKQGPGFNPADCGFDFSSEELHSYLERTATQFRLMQTRPDFDKVIAAYRATQKEPLAA